MIKFFINIYFLILVFYIFFLFEGQNTRLASSILSTWNSLHYGTQLKTPQWRGQFMWSMWQLGSGRAQRTTWTKLEHDLGIKLSTDFEQIRFWWQWKRIFFKPASFTFFLLTAHPPPSFTAYLFMKFCLTLICSAIASILKWCFILCNSQVTTLGPKFL
jgi:hypothetical protein